MSKQTKKHLGISPERLAGLRLSGSKVTDEQVEQILSDINKPSVRRPEYRTNQAFLGKSASISV